MRRLKRSLFWMLIDLLIGLFSYIGVYSTRSLSTPLDLNTDLSILFLATAITIIWLYIFGVYDRIWSQTSGHGITIILSAVILAFLTNSMIVLLTSPRILPMSILILSNILIASGVIAVRYRSRLIDGLNWRWRAIWHRDFPQVQERVLIVGAGESGQALALRLKHRFSERAYQVVGFIDDAVEKQSMYVEGCPILGTRVDISRIVREHKIDLIIVAIHRISGQDFREILTYCEKASARIKVAPDMMQLLNEKSRNTLLRDVRAEDLIGRGVITRHEAVDLTPVTAKIVLVTGAAGSIGSEISRQIASYTPVHLVLLDNNESALHDLLIDINTQFPEIKATPVLADVTHKNSLHYVFEKYHPQVVFHAAAYKHVPMLEYYPQEAIRVNIHGTYNLVQTAIEHTVERFVLISTDKAVEPTNVMGATKRLCELIVHAFAQRDNHATLLTAVRFGNVLGSRGSVVPTFTRQIINGGPITITHPDMSRFFMSIPEASNLVIHAACLTDGDDIFVLRMGEEVRILDIAERMIRLHGLRPYEDINIEFIGIRPGEKMNEVLHLDGENPSNSIHPHIIRLNSWINTFDTEVFLQNIRNLEIEAGMQNGNLIKHLLSLHLQNHEHVVSMD